MQLRTPEAVLTNAPAVRSRRKHSRETQRGYEPHTGGDDTSHTHKPVHHSQERSLYRRRIIKLYLTVGGIRSNIDRTMGQTIGIETRLCQPEQIRSVDGGPSNGLVA